MSLKISFLYIKFKKLEACSYQVPREPRSFNVIWQNKSFLKFF